MTIASEIERLQDVRTDIYDELGNKCVNLDDSSKYADVAPIIKKMPVVCAKIGANKYPVVKIGNQLWTAKNLDEDLGTIGTNEWYYNGRTEKTSFTSNHETTRKAGESGNANIQYWSNADGISRAKFARGKKLTASGTITLSEAQNVNTTHVVQIAVVNTEGVTSWPIFGRFVMQSGSTSLDFCGSISVAENVERFSVIYVIVGSTSSAKAYSATITNFVLHVGEGALNVSDTTDYDTALANEATYKKYGRLYTWDNVNTNLASLGLQGWRMPTLNDFRALASIDSTGKKFRSKNYGGGTDDYGLAILPSGRWHYDLGFDRIGTHCHLWSSTEKDSSSHYNALFNLSILMPTDSNPNATRGFSVRLVCDLNEDGSIPDGAVIIAEADESVATLSEDGVAVASVEPSTDSES